jgi:hypothetical protein
MAIYNAINKQRTTLEVNRLMNIKEKEERINKTLEMMTETDLKAICFEAFLDGLEKGIKIRIFNYEGGIPTKQCNSL